MDPNWPAHYTVGPRQGIRLIRKGEDPGWGEIIYVTTIYIYIYPGTRLDNKGHRAPEVGGWHTET